MNCELPGAPVSKKQLQRGRNRAKRELVPGDLVFGEQSDLEAFASRREVEVEQFSAEKDMDLFDVRHVEHRKKGAEIDSCAGFLGGLAYCALRRAFADLHETCRQCPLSIARF